MFKNSSKMAFLLASVMTLAGTTIPAGATSPTSTQQQETAPIRYDETAHTIPAKVGQTFEISMPDLISTGSQWEPVFDQNRLSLVRSYEERSSRSTPFVGPGNDRRVFLFRALASGSCSVAMNLTRSHDRAIRTVQFDIETTPATPAGINLSGRPQI